MDCIPPGSSIHGIVQARILEWVAISFSRASSRPRDRTLVSHITGRCFNLWATREDNPKERQYQRMAKECSNYCTIVLISHASKVMLKILQARLQHYVNCEHPDVQAGFRKGTGARDQITNIHWNMKKQESSRKTSTFASLTTLKPLSVWITTNCGKFLNRWECQTTLPASWEICMQFKKQQLELDMEQWTGSKLGKGVYEGCILPCFTYMQSTSCEMLGWMKHKLESRLLEEISITSDMQMTPPLWQRVKKN